jgi:hypothetical protein
MDLEGGVRQAREWHLHAFTAQRMSYGDLVRGRP